MRPQSTASSQGVISLSPTSCQWQGAHYLTSQPLQTGRLCQSKSPPSLPSFLSFFLVLPFVLLPETFWLHLLVPRGKRFSKNHESETTGSAHLHAHERRPNCFPEWLHQVTQLLFYSFPETNLLKSLLGSLAFNPYFQFSLFYFLTHTEQT